MSAAPGLLERLRRRLAQRLWWLPFGRVPEVTAGSLAAELSNGGRPQLLDVRTAHEFREGHVDGAVNVPVSELHRHLDRLRLQPGRPVVAICLSGHRSVPAVRLLRAHGWPDVRQLAGGMRAWRKEGRPVVQPPAHRSGDADAR